MVAVEIRTNLRMDARWAFALMTKVELLSMHRIHIGRRSSEVAQIPFEVGHLGDGFHFFKNALLAA